MEEIKRWKQRSNGHPKKGNEMDRTWGKKGKTRERGM
jgi:hypothetical protein